MRRKRKKRLVFKAVDKKGIPLAELISAHQQFNVAGSLPENIGDGFLCANNPIFSAIRQEFLRLGNQFSQDDHFHYYAFPLMALDSVMAAKIVPYRNNFIWLKILQEKMPKQFTLTELKRSELQFNYVFHETAHFIAHNYLFGERKFDRILKDDESLLKILIGEAFANTVECLASIHAAGEIDSYFLDANCYFRSTEKEVKKILLFTKKIGKLATAKVLMIAFLYSNFMYEFLDNKELKSTAKLAGVDPKINIKPLVQVCLTLSRQFRTTTTQLHLMKLGFPIDLNPFFRFDPAVKLLEAQQSTIRDGLNRLALLVSDGY